MLIPTASAAPGASSQPAEIRGGSGMGVSRLKFGHRGHRTGVSGMGCNDMLDIGYDGSDSTPCFGVSVDDPAVTEWGPPATVTPGRSTMGAPGAVYQPTNTGGAYNWNQAISGLNQTLAIAQGGGVITTPYGSNIQGSPGAAAIQAATSSQIGTAAAGLFTGSGLMIAALAGVALLMISSRGR